MLDKWILKYLDAIKNYEVDKKLGEINNLHSALAIFI